MTTQGNESQRIRRSALLKAIRGSLKFVLFYFLLSTSSSMASVENSDVYLGSELDAKGQSFSYLGVSAAAPIDQSFSLIGRVFTAYLRYKFESANMELTADVPMVIPAVGIRYKKDSLSLTGAAGLDLRRVEKERVDGGKDRESKTGLSLQGEFDIWGDDMKNLNLLASYSTIDDFYWLRGRTKKKVYEFGKGMPFLFGVEAAGMGNSDFSASQIGVVGEVLNTATSLSILVKGGYKETTSFGGSGYTGIELYYRFH